LHELDLLLTRHYMQQEREDRRAAMAAWMLVNVNRDTDKKREPFDLEEVTRWLGYGAQYVRPPTVVEEAPAASPAEIRRRLGIVYQLHRLTSSPNGERG
jgi:hypothetical protein